MKEPKESQEQEVRLLLTRARNLLSHPGFWVDSPEGQASRLKLREDIFKYLYPEGERCPGNILHLEYCEGCSRYVKNSNSKTIYWILPAVDDDSGSPYCPNYAP